MINEIKSTSLVTFHTLYNINNLMSSDVYALCLFRLCIISITSCLVMCMLVIDEILTLFLIGRLSSGSSILDIEAK